MIYTGSDTFIGGVDSGKNPNMLQHNQIAWGENVTVRGGQLNQRPGFSQLSLTGDIASVATRLNVQGFEFYERNGVRGYMIIAAGGRLFRCDLSATAANIDEIGISGDNLNDAAKKIFSVQAGEYMVFQDGSSIPVIYDGANSRRATNTEVPIGSGPMAFGMGRLWVAQGREYVAGDIEGGSAGVLSFTENDFLNEGGSFLVPTRSGAITAMTFTAAPNTALGQGELLITTPDSVYSTVLPTDRTTWKSVTDPVQRIVLINNGSLSQESTTIVNGDVFMRSRDGVRSVVQAVRQFDQLGNVPISREMNRAFSSDASELLPYTSAITFDNRLLMTTGASLISGQPYFTSIAALDFDLISSMGQRSPPVWDGIWNGYKFIRLGKGRFNGTERAFALVKNTNKGFVKSVVVSVGETTAALTGNITLTVSGGGGTGSVVDGCYTVTSATIASAGSGYAVGDTVSLTASGATRQASFIVTSVSAGAVTGVALINGGDYSTAPTSLSYSTTTLGAGTGCELRPTCKLYRITVSSQGSDYTSQPTISGIFQGTLDPCTNLVATAFLDYEWEIWEISKDLDFDRPLDGSGVAYDSRIVSTVETAAFPFSTPEIGKRERKKITGGVLWLNGVRGDVDFVLSYKPDTFPCWQTWHSFQLSTKYTDCTTSTTCAPHSYLAQSVPYINLPTPPDACDTARNAPLNIARTFQARLQWTGATQVQMIEMKAQAYSEENNPPCVNATETTSGLECTNCGL